MNHPKILQKTTAFAVAFTLLAPSFSLAQQADAEAPAAITPASDNAAPQTLEPAVLASTPARLEAPYSGRVVIDTTIATGDGQRYPDTTLRVVNKAHKGVDVGLLVVGALLGSFRLPVSKEENRGSKIDSMIHPAASGEIISGLTKEVNRWHAERGTDTKYKNPLLVRADTFSLIYGDFNEERPYYELNFQTTVSRKADSAGWFTAPVSVTCANQYAEPKLTQAQWEADDYAQVKARRVEHTEACIKKVQASFDKLFQE